VRANTNAPGPAGSPGREDERQPRPIVAPGDDGPGCGHALCLFERNCLGIQAEVELRAARADRAHRRKVGLLLVDALSLAQAEAPLFEVACYSGSLKQRKRAGDLLAVALQRVVRRAA